MSSERLLRLRGCCTAASVIDACGGQKSRHQLYYRCPFTQEYALYGQLSLRLTVVVVSLAEQLVRIAEVGDEQSGPR